MLQYQQIKELARYLRGKARDIAIAQQDGEVYYTRLSDVPEQAPFSPIVNIIQVLNTHGYMGYGTFLKQPSVYHTGQASVMDMQMAAMNDIKLFDLDRKSPGRDFSLDDYDVKMYEVPDDGRFLPFGDFTMPSLPGLSFSAMGGSSRDTLDRLYMMTAFALVTRRFVFGGSEGANIGAILVAPTGTILAWALNAKENNSTSHAEVKLMQSLYFNKLVPLEKLADCRLYTTLKPCAMCAGMIQHVGAGAINVIYGRNEPSVDASNTVLDKRGDRQWLLQHREDTKTRGNMGQSLGLDQARNIMLMASTTTMNNELRGLKAEVGKAGPVYRHIKDFLKAQQVSPTQIARAVATLYGPGEPYGGPQHFTLM